MTDLFQSAQAQLDADIEDRRHECEVRDCVKRYYPDGQAMADYLAKVEKARGHGPADRLRSDVRKAWARHRDELAGQG